MRIGITGANGRLGNGIIDYLSQEHEVVSFGRSDSNHHWTLGVTPSQQQFASIDVFIHLAWSLRDRTADYHLNVGGTLVLAQAAQDSKVPFLFISSVAAESESSYGKAKLEAELLVLECGGSVMRLGLVPDSNRYTKTGDKYFSIYPNFGFKIPITTFEQFTRAIDEWIFSDRKQNCMSGKRELLSGKMRSKDLFTNNSKLAIPVPLPLIKLVLSICGPFSLKARNLLDAMLSVRTS